MSRSSSRHPDRHEGRVDDLGLSAADDERAGHEQLAVPVVEVKVEDAAARHGEHLAQRLAVDDVARVNPASRVDSRAVGGIEADRYAGGGDARAGRRVYALTSGMTTLLPTM